MTIFVAGFSSGARLAYRQSGDGGMVQRCYDERPQVSWLPRQASQNLGISSSLDARSGVQCPGHRRDGGEQLQMELIDRIAMGREVSESLWSVYHRRPEGGKLVLPRKRDGTRRVSEQESKILITRWLEGHGYFYSIETPTTQQYRQSGRTDISARIDITVNGWTADSARAVNIELKAGTATVEAFRKDFESSCVNE